MQWFVIKQRKLIIAVAVIISLLAVIPIFHSTINPDLESYMPDNLQAKINNQLIEEVFGSDEMVLLVFEAEDVLDQPTLERIKNLSKEFNKMKQFHNVISLFDTKSIKGEYGAMIVDPAVKRIPKSEKRKEKLRQELKKNKLANKMVVSEDFTCTIILLNLESNTSDNEAIAIVEQLLKKYPGKENIYIAGQPKLRIELNDKISRDLMLLLPLGIIIMIIFLYFSFREKRGVLLPLTVVVISILICMGLIPALGWELSLIAILVPIMMIAIANDYGIHFISLYQELNARKNDWSIEKISRESYLHLKKPVIITGLTTIVGILGLATHIMIPARQMGIIAAIGILVALLLSIFLIPAILSGMKKGKPLKTFKTKNKYAISKILHWFSSISTQKPYPVIAVFLAFLVLSGLGISRLEVSINNDLLLPKKNSFSIATGIANEKFAGTKNVSVFFEGDIKNPDFLKRLIHYEQELEKMPEVGNVLSIASMIKIMSKAINDPGDPYYDVIPDSREAVAQYLALYSMSGDPDDFENLVDFNYQNALLNVQFKLEDTESIYTLLNKIDELTLDDPYRKLIGGETLFEKQMAEAMISGQYRSLIFAFAAISLLLMLIFKSFYAGFMGSLPLFFSVICNFGLMGWLGMKLDIATAMISSIAIGIGVDYTIHFFWRMKIELEKELDFKKAIYQTIVNTGRGIAINAFSVIVGFSVLFLSSFTIIKSFAFLIIFSILLCMLAALVLIPAMSILIRPKFMKPKINQHDTKTFRNYLKHVSF